MTRDGNRVAYSAKWIIDGTSRGPLENAAIVVDGSDIVEVSKVSELPQDLHIIDLGESTLLPGLIDCHVHLPFDGSPDPVAVFMSLSTPQATLRALKHATKALEMGITTVRDVSTPYGISIALRDMVDAGEVVGPRILSAGTHICITGGHGSRFGVEVDSPQEMRKAVRAQFKAGADFIKLMGTGGVYSMGLKEAPDQVQLQPDEMRAATEVAHGFGRRVASHSEGERGIRVALDAGVDTIEHGNHLTEELAHQMVEQNAFLVPTVGAFRNSVGRTDINHEYVIKSIDLAEASETALNTAREIGVKVACGTDRGTAMQMPWSRHYLVEEIEYLVKFGGFSPMQAVQSATAVGAEALDIDSYVGTLAPGKKADFIAVSGNALMDLGLLKRPTLVVKGGQCIARN